MAGRSGGAGLIPNGGKQTRAESGEKGAGLPDLVSLSPDLAQAVAEANEAISHNLNGQRLGRKGKDTRERILAAAIVLIEECQEDPVTLAQVAKAAGTGLSALYNYFTDLPELLEAILAPVMVTARKDYFALAREHWPDERLGICTLDFVRRYHAFWARHTGLLHLRNNLADRFDARMMRQRIESTQPLIQLIIAQMDAGDQPSDSAIVMASSVMTGLERSITLATDRRIHKALGTRVVHDEDVFLTSNARLLELAIRDARSKR